MSRPSYSKVYTRWVRLSERRKERAAYALELHNRLRGVSGGPYTYHINAKYLTIDQWKMVDEPMPPQTGATAGQWVRWNNQGSLVANGLVARGSVTANIGGGV